MDFLERILGVSPDNGSGLMEAAILVALGAVVWLRYGLRAWRISRRRAAAR